MARRLAMGSVLVLVLAAGSAGAAPRVLATSGTKVDGLGVASVEAPGAMADGRIVFRGASTTLTIGGTTFATGEPLPAPFTGTIDEVFGGAGAGTLGGVLLSASGPDIAGAIFAVENGTVTPLLTVAPTEAVDVRRFTMNARGDLVYVSLSSRGGEIFARPRATGVSTRIAGPDRNFRTLRALVIDASGAAAWMGRKGGVWYWNAERGTAQLSNDRYPTRSVSGGSPIALHETFGLIFVTRDMFGAYSPETGLLSVVARRREVVAGSTITYFFATASFTDDGTGTVLVRGRKATRKYLCLPPGGPIAECESGGSIVSAGTPIGAIRRSALFRVNGDNVRAIVRPGDVLDGLGALGDVDEHQVAGGSVAFLGVLEDGRDVLGWWRGGRVAAALADGSSTAGGRTLDVAPSLYDATESSAVVGGSQFDAAGEPLAHGTGLLLARRGGRVTSIRSPRKSRFSDFTPLDAAIAGGRLFVLTYDALFSVRGRVLVSVVVPRADTPGSLSSIGSIASAGSRVVLVGLRDADPPATLFELEADGPRPLVTPTSDFVVAGVDAADVALVLSVTDDGGATYHDELDLVDLEGSIRTVLAAGDATPVGAVGAIEAVALAADSVVVSARVMGDGARRALLAVRRR